MRTCIPIIALCLTNALVMDTLLLFADCVLLQPIDNGVHIFIWQLAKCRCRGDNHLLFLLKSCCILYSQEILVHFVSFFGSTKLRKIRISIGTSVCRHMIISSMRRLTVIPRQRIGREMKGHYQSLKVFSSTNSVAMPGHMIQFSCK